jgi:hypothetical protein
MLKDSLKKRAAETRRDIIRASIRSRYYVEPE